MFEITPDGVLTAGGVLVGAAALSRYGNPVTATLSLIFGGTAAAAATPCSVFSGPEGLQAYFDLPSEIQLENAHMCPSLAGQVLEISNSLNH